MTENRMALVELLQKSGDADFLQAVAEAVLPILMEADVEGLIGASRHERSAERLNDRNGYRDRTLETRLGTLSVRIPKLRQGSDFPPFLEPRKPAEKALVTVIQEAWIGGVSTRRVDERVPAMGLSGISKSQASKLCKDIDERVNAFLDRPIDGEWPYLWLDATSLKVRDGGRIVSVAAIIAVAVNTEGRREIVGLGIGPSEAAPPEPVEGLGPEGRARSPFATRLADPSQMGSLALIPRGGRPAPAPGTRPPAKARRFPAKIVSAGRAFQPALSPLSPRSAPMITLPAVNI